MNRLHKIGILVVVAPGAWVMKYFTMADYVVRRYCYSNRLSREFIVNILVLLYGCRFCPTRLESGFIEEKENKDVVLNEV